MEWGGGGWGHAPPVLFWQNCLILYYTATTHIRRKTPPTPSMIKPRFIMKCILNLRKHILLCVQVNTKVCEQTFAWLSQYAKITRQMNRGHFLFYLLYLSELHNRHKEC